MTTCDLNAIRERINGLITHGFPPSHQDMQSFLALCTEVEALMKRLEAYQMWVDGEQLEIENKTLRANAVKVGELYNERCEEVQSINALYTEALIEIKALRAKLEKAKEALERIQIRCSVEMAENAGWAHEKAVTTLAELEKP